MSFFFLCLFVFVLNQSSQCHPWILDEYNLLINLTRVCSHFSHLERSLPKSTTALIFMAVLIFWYIYFWKNSHWPKCYKNSTILPIYLPQSLSLTNIVYIYFFFYIFLSLDIYFPQHNQITLYSVKIFIWGNKREMLLFKSIIQMNCKIKRKLLNK